MNGHQTDMHFKEFGLHAQNLFNHSRLHRQHNSGGLLGRFMSLVLLTLKNLTSNSGDQKIPNIVARISNHIRGSKKNPRSDIRVNNHGKQQKLAN